MPIFTRDDRRVLFVHVPKTGGTSIERHFTAADWTMHHRSTPKKQPALFPAYRCSPQHWHGALLSELFRLDRFEARFLVVRDPIARFRSEYVMRNTADPRTDAASVEAWAERALKRYAANPYVHDNHLRPQSEFLVEDCEVYRLEDGLEAAVADLNTRFDLGLGPQVPRSFHSEKRAGVSSSDVEISPGLAERLADFYRSDYDRFGYPLPGAAPEGTR